MATTQRRGSVVTARELLEAGVHFGHQTRRWNPKMKRFIYGERSGIYIIDLRQTVRGIEDAYSFVRELVADGGSILFVSTKRQMTDAIREAAERCDMPYVNYRWLGGMLTNFQTISSRIDYLRELEEMEESGALDEMRKKDALRLRREKSKLQRYLGGMVKLTRVPDAVFIIDTRKEHIAVTEANKLGVPLVAALDTNCDPDEVQYGIPANDDAIRSGVLLCRIIADAVEEGRLLGTRRPRKPKVDPDAEEKRRQAELDARAYEEERAREEAAEMRRAEQRAKIEAAQAAEAEPAAEAGEGPDASTGDDTAAGEAAADDAAPAPAETEEA